MKPLLLLVLAGAAFAQDCPVKVTDVFKSEIHTQGSLLNLTLQSTSDKEIKEANFAVTVLDSAGQPHALMGAFDSGKIKAGTKKRKRYVVGREVLDPFTRVKFQAWTNEITFSDGTTWKDDGSHACVWTK